MSQAAKNEITIYFNVEVPNVFKNAETLQNELIDYHLKTSDDITKPHVNVVDITAHTTEVELVLYSSRRVNLDFQTSLLNKYLNDNFNNELIEISDDIWVQS